MRTLGVVIAGGLSARMGREKAFVTLAGKPLMAHVIDRLRPQVDEVIINSNSPPEHYAVFAVDVIPDPQPDLGTPLAGLQAALHYAAGNTFDAVLTTPSDTPFLPDDLRERLAQAAPAIAMSGGQAHYLTGLWPSRLGPLLDEAIARGMRRVQDFAKLAEASLVSWEGADPFFNVNTPEDLEAAEVRLGH